MRYSYSKIVEILIQSAALVSIEQLAYTVISLVDLYDTRGLGSNGTKIFQQLAVYLGNLQNTFIVRVFFTAFLFIDQ